MEGTVCGPRPRTSPPGCANMKCWCAFQSRSRSCWPWGRPRSGRHSCTCTGTRTAITLPGRIGPRRSLLTRTFRLADPETSPTRAWRQTPPRRMLTPSSWTGSRRIRSRRRAWNLCRPRPRLSPLPNKRPFGSKCRFTVRTIHRSFSRSVLAPLPSSPPLWACRSTPVVVLLKS